MRASSARAEAPPGGGFGAAHGSARDPAVKRLLLRSLPDAPRRQVLRAVRRARYRGGEVECPCCGGGFSRFIAHRGRERAKCPGCGALERHRLLWLFLERETDLHERPGSMLHVAPEYALAQRLARLDGLRYLTADLDSPLADVTLDVTAMPFDEGSFDFLICNHVLEHVDDDRRAMAEVHRVLKPGGWAILMCPVDQRLAETFEDPAILSAEERHRAYGQGDHARLYGRDYAERLAGAGFAVRAEPYLELLDPVAVRRGGLRREGDDAFGEEWVYLCRKAGDGGGAQPSESPRSTARPA